MDLVVEFWKCQLTSETLVSVGHPALHSLGLTSAVLGSSLWVIKKGAGNYLRITKPTEPCGAGR